MYNQVSLITAFLAGLFSFLSPCVLSLVPVYLTTLMALGTRSKVQGTIFQPDYATKEPIVSFRNFSLNSAMFLAGLTVVFIVFSLGAFSLSLPIREHRELLLKIASVIVITMALIVMLSNIRPLAFWFRERRIKINLKRLGKLAPFALGASFGLGWIPCISPVLASILAIASVKSNLIIGALLLVSYALGLGLPFFVFGLIADVRAVVKILGKISIPLSLIGSILLLVLGMLLFSGHFSFLNSVL